MIMDTGYIPHHYAEARVDPKDIPQKLLVALESVVVSFIHRPGRLGLFLTGPNGVGKTHTICAYGHMLKDYGYIRRPAIYVSAASIHDKQGEIDVYRDQPWLRTFMDAELLIIDDLGKENQATEYRKRISALHVGRLLRERDQRDLPTFITTNLDMRDVAPTYGTSVHSLIAGKSFVRLRVTGKDRRK